MDKFIEALLKIIPFSSWFERLGLSKEISAALSVIVVAFLFWQISNYIKSFIEWRKNMKTTKNLMPQFDYSMVRRATHIYIPTQYQNASPTRQDEPGFTHEYVSRSPLIPFFLKTAFNSKVDSERFYLILADSGMGKTTFMINLYMRYHSFFNYNRKYKMRLFRFSHPDTLPDIKSTKKEESKDTILLLDALDEDPNIVSKDPNITDAQAFQNRVNEIIEATRNFREVIMTCRTQYFPGQENDPYELEVKRPDETGFYKLNKLYISPFNDKEVKCYLNKKFGYWPLSFKRNKRRASQVIRQSRHLTMRPMMLSFIDLLVKSNHNYDSVYDIYETLVEGWLKREAEKRKHSSESWAFMKNLRNVSQQTALAIYQNWKKEQRMYLTKFEAVNIANQNQIDLKAEEVTGQSLLTCDGFGNWKFAHKTILEFFLATQSIKNFSFFVKFSFTGMDMAIMFFEEKNPNSLSYFSWESIPFVHDGYKKIVKSWIGREYVKAEEFLRNDTLFMEKGNNFSKIDPKSLTVSWFAAIDYCDFLNKKYGYPTNYDSNGEFINLKSKEKILSIFGFRLPFATELDELRKYKFPFLYPNLGHDFEWCNERYLGGDKDKDGFRTLHSPTHTGNFDDPNSLHPFRIIFVPKYDVDSH